MFGLFKRGLKPSEVREGMLVRRKETRAANEVIGEVGEVLRVLKSPATDRWDCEVVFGTARRGYTELFSPFDLGRLEAVNKQVIGALRGKE